MSTHARAFLKYVLTPLRDLGHNAVVRTSGSHAIRLDCSCGFHGRYLRHGAISDEAARRRLRRKLAKHLRTLLSASEPQN